MKGSWSREGSKIVFFKVTKFIPRVAYWKTAICVVNIGGVAIAR